MTSHDLTPEQVCRLRDRFGRDREYLERLVRRMQELGMGDSGNCVYRHALLAHDAMEKLWRAAVTAGSRHGQVREADPFSGSDPARA